jgi:hypothetical protein
MLRVVMAVVAPQGAPCTQRAAAWDSVLGWDAAPLSKQILGVELGQGHLTLAVALAVQRARAEVWGVHASRGLGPRFPLGTGRMSAKDGATTRRHQGTTMLARALAVTQKKRLPCLMAVVFDHAA